MFGKLERWYKSCVADLSTRSLPQQAEVPAQGHSYPYSNLNPPESLTDCLFPSSLAVPLRSCSTCPSLSRRSAMTFRWCPPCRQLLKTSQWPGSTSKRGPTWSTTPARSPLFGRTTRWAIRRAVSLNSWLVRASTRFVCFLTNSSRFG